MSTAGTTAGRTIAPSIRTAAVAALLLGALLTAYCVVLAAGQNGKPAAHVTYIAAEVVAVAACLARVISVGRDRRLWTHLSVFAIGWLVGDTVWDLWIEPSANPPVPSIADPMYLAGYAAALAALVTHFLSIRPRRTPFAFDGVIVALAVGAVLVITLYGPVLTTLTTTGVQGAVDAGYLVIDLVLLAVLGAVLGQVAWRPSLDWLLITGSLSVLILADALFGYAEVTDRAWVWAYPLFPFALALLGVAAWAPPMFGVRSYEARPAFVVPTLAVLAALGVLLTTLVTYKDRHLAAGLLALLALSGTALRAALTQLENVRLLDRARADALSDGLTGLGNRRRLMRDIDHWDEASGSASVVFFDLDGFKGYNDRFGHAAGDALLHRLGRRLDSVCTDWGAAYRLGGDEFCVLTESAIHAGSPEVAATVAALTEHGEGFTVGVSHGLVVLPDEAADAAEALRLADERMYARKRQSRVDRDAVDGHEARDALVALQRERELENEERLAALSELAVLVGRRLGLTGGRLDEIGRAAELHDIGNVAVPESVLAKPGPLAPDEWEIVRQHTEIGGRVLGVAPAMRPVARLVRSSHERWDGRGYPDGLAGEQIPHGARILAACDAYEAMRRTRPYAAARTHREALAEIERGAGTQFDPRVAATIAALAGAHHPVFERFGPGDDAPAAPGPSPRNAEM